MIAAGFLGEVGSWVQVILGVGLLVFIHEAGHFLAARWAGVRVLTFSLGFGPEIWGFTRGPTRYRVSAVPLGGYVKMSGETERPGGGYEPDDYPSQPVWKRAIIIGAGVAMNAVLGFALYLAAFTVGIKMDPVIVGNVAHGGAAWEAGIRPGDRLVAADGDRLVAFPDLVHATLSGEALVLDVVRDGTTLRVPVPARPAGEGIPRGIGVSPDPGARLVVGPIGEKEIPCPFRTGDRIVAVGGLPATLATFGDEILVEAAHPLSGTLPVTVLRDGAEVVVPVAPSGTARRIGIAALRTTVDRVRGGGPAAAAGVLPGDRPVAVAGTRVAGASSFRRALAAAAPGADGTVPVAVLRDGREVPLAAPGEPAARLEFLRDLRFAAADSPTAVEVLATGPPGPDGAPRPSAAAAAGIPSGARITEIQGTPVAAFRDVVTRITEVKEGPVRVSWESDAGKGSAAITPDAVPLFGLPWRSLESDGNPEFLRASGIGEAVALAADRTVITTKQIVGTVVGLFRGSVDKGALGGPILIAQVAHRSSKEGIGHFLWLLGMLSMNLMVLNILPIPLLDGGQLALLGVEAVTRKPPSEAVVGWAQMAGLVLLLGFMLYVSFQDVLRLVN